MDRAEKQRFMDLLRKGGWWEEADKYREETRQRLRTEGKSKQVAVSEAWDTMAEKYLPLVERAESGFRTILPDKAESVDDMTDPDYQEADPVIQLRDAYAWIAAEFHRMVSDHETGTVLDFGRASAPPPIGLACSIAQTWAAKPREQRTGLFREIRQCLGAFPAASSSLAEPEPTPAYTEADAYLEGLGE